MLDSILNREKFSYDFNADPIYQQYAQRYQNQGKLAMMDTMGEAASLTGGYGNTYAQTAGQQAYQGYLQGLNDVIPELYESAYGKYQNTGDQMRSNLSSLQQMESSDYGKYTDKLNQYYDELDYFYNKYDDLSDADYAKYMNNMSLWAQQRDYWYQKQLEEEAAKNAGRGGGPDVDPLFAAYQAAMKEEAERQQKARTDLVDFQRQQREAAYPQQRETAYPPAPASGGACDTIPSINSFFFIHKLS